ncbi:iron-binding protein [Ottowia sp. GY511]|uniref:CDGSH iron-sulfur domain-containing protein n=1 Tax=Ottowia flava TaxID=2675430 RepID=A0ABW4KU54_9BURK|nr:CDGSH iron-sulfur domain-containing protein [Ottowia sp. GY511]TXK22412.1 iron-binding protein [Ottowia sp. GY511]
MPVETVKSDSCTIEFHSERCIHARNCVLSRPDVFVPNVQGAWIHPERATAEQVLELAHNCPSGAIQCKRPDGSALETAPEVNTVRVRENGPLAFHAPLDVAQDAVGFHATLCRCGASQSKPYCDGSHNSSGFQATGEPPTKPSEALPQRDGPLTVTPTKNGPLHVQGSLEVVSGTGRTVNRVTDTWLCRCGHSQNKPFCDGSHAKFGFQADGV